MNLISRGCVSHRFGSTGSEAAILPLNAASSQPYQTGHRRISSRAAAPEKSTAKGLD